MERMYSPFEKRREYRSGEEMGTFLISWKWVPASRPKAPA
jgi:hypothetical protein